MANLSTARLLREGDVFLRELQVIRTSGQRLVSALMFNGQFPDRRGVVAPGIFGHLRRGEASWNYLFLAGVPQTTAQIWAAVEERGKCKTKAKDGLKAQYSCLYNSEKFKRFGLDHWTIAT